MPSDPSTKDLIAAARENYAHRSGCRYKQGYGVDPLECATCLRLALADRLEKVEEEREEYMGLVREAVVAALDPGPSEYTVPPTCPECDRPMDSVPPRWCCEKGHPAVWKPLDSPEPSDPEPEDDPWVNATSLLEILEQVAREKGEDWPPEPDPWYRIEAIAKAPSWTPGPKFAPTVAHALLDLRDRVEESRRMRVRIQGVGVDLGALEDRLTTLEGHAERGSEVVTALEGRVETLDEERKVSLEARRHLFDEVEKLWRMEERVADIEAVLPVPATEEDPAP